MKTNKISSLLVCMMLAVSGCSKPEQSSPSFSTTQTTILSDVSDSMEEVENRSSAQSDTEQMPVSLASILNEIDSCTKECLENLESETTRLTDLMQNGHTSLIQAAEQMPDYYAETLRLTQNYYSSMQEAEQSYFYEVEELGTEIFRVWNSQMDALYTRWNTAMTEVNKTWIDEYQKILNSLNEAAAQAQSQEASMRLAEISELSAAGTADMQNAYSEAWSEGYQMYSDVWSGFYHGRHDVNAILAAALESRPQRNEISGNLEGLRQPEVNEAEPAQESGNSESDSSDVYRPENRELPSHNNQDFTGLMKKYEQDMDTYLDFVHRFVQAGQFANMIEEYYSQLDTCMKAMQELESMDPSMMSPQEQSLYFETMLDCFDKSNEAYVLLTQ